MAIETYILKRIEMMQEELEQLRRAILRKDLDKAVSLRGIWKGVDFSDAEIEEAKHLGLKE
jgi:hypothetical protein